MIFLISITLLALLSKVEGSDCEGFRAAACPLTESNILGFDNKQDLASCQRQCQINSNCNWFTRFLSIKSDKVRAKEYDADIFSYADQCWQLTDCSYLEICPVPYSFPKKASYAYHPLIRSASADLEAPQSSRSAPGLPSRSLTPPQRPPQPPPQHPKIVMFSTGHQRDMYQQF